MCARRVQYPGLQALRAERVAALLLHAQRPLGRGGEVAQADGAGRVQEGVLEGGGVAAARRDTVEAPQEALAQRLGG